MTLYRVYGGDKAKVDGAYWTLEPPKTKETWKNDYAVLDEWGNDANKIVKYTVKEGDNIGGWTGAAAKQTSENGAQILNGGKQQIFIDLRGKDLVDVELPNNWN